MGYDYVVLAGLELTMHIRVAWNILCLCSPRTVIKGMCHVQPKAQDVFCYLCVCAHVCMCTCVHDCVGACGVKKKVSNYLMLDLLVTVSHAMWVLIFNLGPLQEQQMFLISEPSSHSFPLLKMESHSIVQIGLELTV